MPVCPSSPFFGHTLSATDVHPVWPAVQSGHRPHAMTQPAPSAPFPVPPTPVAPQVARQQYHHSTWLCPWWLGQCQLLSSPCATIPNRLPTRPMATLPAVLHRSTGHSEEVSKMAKPNNSLVRIPRSYALHSLLYHAFNSQPRKFATDQQRVSYAASYLSNITMLWWQPILVTFQTVHLQRLGRVCRSAEHLLWAA